MKENFRPDTIEIYANRTTSNEIVLQISSDYSRSEHKGRLYVNESYLATDVERFWKSIKTKKLLKLNVSFGEIDWYDNMTNIYQTPIVHIERGLKKVRIDHQEHGSIPKDWSFHLSARFADTNTKTPLIEVIKSALGSYFTPQMEKQVSKQLKSLLQKKSPYAKFYVDQN